MLEYELRATVGGLTELDHRSQLLLVGGATLLVVEQVATQVDRREVSLQPLPAAASMLANEAVSLEEREDDLRLSLRYLGDVGDVAERDRLVDRIFLERERDARRFLDFRIPPAKEVSLNPTVLYAVQHRAKRR